jgi:hypothetical protein
VCVCLCVCFVLFCLSYENGVFVLLESWLHSQSEDSWMMFCMFCRTPFVFVFVYWLFLFCFVLFCFVFVLLFVAVCCLFLIVYCLLFA